MEIGIDSLLMLIAISQGIFFALLLLTSSKYRSRPNLFLALVVMDLALIILRVSEIIDHPLLTEIFEYLAVEYLLPAFLYFYVLTGLKQKISPRTSCLLLAPFAFFSIIRTFTSVADFLDIEAWGQIAEAIESIELYVIALFIITVAIVAIRKVGTHTVRPVFKRWLYVNFYGFIGLMTLLLMAELFEIVYEVNYWGFSWAAISIFLMSISFFGVQQVNIERQVERIRDLQVRSAVIPSKKRENHPKGHFEKLLQRMHEEQLYKNPALSRETVATHLGIGTSTISRLVKENDGQSFNDFVNQYRVTLARDLLNDPHYDIFSLEAIGKEVGFKSRSSFYDTFKKMTGLTPGQYKKKADLS